MRMSTIEKEVMLFIEVFGLASLPGMLNSFLVSPSLKTLPYAVFAISMYVSYRVLVNVRKEYLEDISEKKDSDKESKRKDFRLKEGHNADVKNRKP